MRYGESLYVGNSLRWFAKLYLKSLPDEVNTLISTGSSGNSIASAMLALSPAERQLHHIQVRKEEESAHCQRYAGNIHPISSFKYGIYAIVDDFIQTGDTMNRVIKWCKDYDITINYVIVSYVDAGESFRKFLKRNKIKTIIVLEK